MNDHNIREGDWARVRYDPNCPGYPGHPHHPAEEGARVKISLVNDTCENGHRVHGNYKGAPWSRWDVPNPERGLGVGRSFRPEELEILPPGQIDPTPEDYERRRAELRERLLGPRPDPA
jgi:hypothetical protein